MRLSSKIDFLNGKFKKMDYIVEQLQTNNLKLKELNKEFVKDNALIAKIKKICGTDFKFCIDQVEEIDNVEVFHK